MSHLTSPSTGCDAACPLAGRSAGPAALATHGVDRRTFLSQAMLAAAAAALAACGSSGGGDPTAPTSIGSTITLANFPALASVGGIATATLNGSPVAIVRTGPTNYIALSMICTHRGATLNVVNGGFLCPSHGAQFTDTGVWTGGQYATHLDSFPTTYAAAAGTLTIG